MVIVYTYFSLANKAGLERILIDKMNYFANQKDNEVYIITYEQGEHPDAFVLSSKIKHIDLNIRFFPHYKKNRIKRIIKIIQYKRLFNYTLKKIVNRINPDIIICTSYIPKEIYAIASIPTNAIKILESHTAKNFTGDCYKYRNNSFLGIYAKIENFFIEKAIKKFDAIVALTDNDAKLWEPINKTYVIQNMINSIPQEKSSCKAKSIISVGRLCEQKGYDILIDCWEYVHKKHSDWKLHIYGEGGDRENLIKLIEMKDLNDVIYLDGETSDIFDKYLQSSIFVMSSRYEGFGLVLIEAMSCGLPCVSFDCPYGPSDIIKNNEDGYLVDYLNKEELADKINYLIEHEDIRKKMGTAAIKNIVRFLPEYIMPQWENLFNKLVTKKKNNII